MRKSGELCLESHWKKQKRIVIVIKRSTKEPEDERKTVGKRGVMINESQEKEW